MNIRSVKLACFSPTGTSRAINQAIGEGLEIDNVEVIDATQLNSRQTALQASNDELLVLAMPVYSGRLPVVAEKWLQTISLKNTPTVCVVVYGNREYDDALLELQDIVKQRGGLPVACAAFIGEHSFSADNTPIAVARPDANDLQQAKAFGHKVQGIMESFLPEVGIEVPVPGNRPYKELGIGAPVDFIDVSEVCTRCGICASVCPVEAINKKTPSTYDMANCIRCCACIKACPEQARSMKEGVMMDVAKRLNSMCQERKEPVTFFPA
ncbi:MAG: 4Fe-4S binding protein [Halodesulfovibrio sp.]|uniref:4Fe-4S binding protein n=1 Tax=Halodesulfovibrio sp. TaxID=1912772 RepID=UPI00359F06CA